MLFQSAWDQIDSAAAGDSVRRATIAKLERLGIIREYELSETAATTIAIGCAILLIVCAIASRRRLAAWIHKLHPVQLGIAMLPLVVGAGMLYNLFTDDGDFFGVLVQAGDALAKSGRLGNIVAAALLGFLFASPFLICALVWLRVDTRKTGVAAE